MDKCDANEIVTHYEYDSLERLFAVVENYWPPVMPVNETNIRIEYSYDINKNRLTIRDANEVLNESDDESYFIYDALGRQIAEIDQAGNTWSQVFNILGNQIARTEINGETIFYVFDAISDLLTIGLSEFTADVYYI
jgi:YD repeat-containing protein